MKKLMLNLDELKVDSFETITNEGKSGTVQAYTGGFTACGAGCYTNPAYHICSQSNSIDYNTCGAGCNRTDAPQNSCAPLIESGCC